MTVVSGGVERVRVLESRLRETQGQTEQFASHICHDVEESLRSVTALAQMVEGRLSGDERAILDHVLATNSRVRHLLRSFLSYCQLDRCDRANPGPVDLGLAAASAQQALRARIEETAAAIQSQGPFPVVRGDFSEWQRVFEQIISNALDYRWPGSRPSVAIAAGQSGPEEWTVSIQDDGPGIPPEYQTLVFLPFKRLHGREIPGSGMGLAIAKRIVEAHGGRIWVESGAESGKVRGARFCIAVPFAGTAAGHARDVKETV